MELDNDFVRSCFPIFEQPNLEVYAPHFGTTEDNPNIRANKVLTLFQQHEYETVQPLLDFLDSHTQLRLFGKTDATLRAPTVAFVSDAHSPLALTQALAEQKIMAGSGDFYSYRLVESLGLDPESGVCRTSMVHYNNAAEVQRVITALQTIHS